MILYAQNNQAWAGLPIGTSSYQMGPYGCLTTDIAMALADAGYALNPGDVVRQLSASNAYTSSSYVYGAGLLIWSALSKAYPQITYYYGTQGTYKLVQVMVSGVYEHWLLQLPDGTYCDPEYGDTGMKPNYKPTGTVHSISITPAPVPVVTTASVNIPVTGFYVVLNANMNVRDQPTTGSAVYTTYAKGSEIECDGTVTGDDINGNTNWYHTHLHGKFLSAAYCSVINQPSNPA
jgi:hypothetical protein